MGTEVEPNGPLRGLVIGRKKKRREKVSSV